MKRSRSDFGKDPDDEGRVAKQGRYDIIVDSSVVPESAHPSTQASLWNSSVVKYKSKNLIPSPPEDEDDGLLNLYGRILGVDGDGKLDGGNSAGKIQGEDSSAPSLPGEFGSPSRRLETSQDTQPLESTIAPRAGQEPSANIRVAQDEIPDADSAALNELLESMHGDFSHESDALLKKPGMLPSALKEDLDSDFKPIHIPRKLPRWMQAKEVIQELELKATSERRFQKVALMEQSSPEIDSVVTQPKAYTILKDIEPLLKDRIVVFDTETTGFTLSDGILEIGAIELRNGIRTGLMFHSFIKSPAKIHPMAFKVHGIDEAAVSGAPPPHAVLMEFLKWVNKAPLVVHNAKAHFSFDMRLISQDLDRYRLGYLLKEQPVFDTMSFYRSFVKTREYSLDDVAKKYNVSTLARAQHTALVDAEVLSEVFVAMANSFIRSKELPQ